MDIFKLCQLLKKNIPAVPEVTPEQDPQYWIANFADGFVLDEKKMQTDFFRAMEKEPGLERMRRDDLRVPQFRT